MQIAPIRPYNVGQKQSKQNTNFKALRKIEFRKGTPINVKMEVLKMFEQPEIKKMFENWNINLEVLGSRDHSEIRMFVDTKFGNHEFRFHSFDGGMPELEEGLKKGYNRIKGYEDDRIRWANYAKKMEIEEARQEAQRLAQERQIQNKINELTNPSYWHGKSATKCDVVNKKPLIPTEAFDNAPEYNSLTEILTPEQISELL